MRHDLESGVYFKDITIREAGAAKKIAATADIAMQNVTVNGELI